MLIDYSRDYNFLGLELGKKPYNPMFFKADEAAMNSIEKSVKHIAVLDGRSYGMSEEFFVFIRSRH